MLTALAPRATLSGPRRSKAAVLCWRYWHAGGCIRRAKELRPVLAELAGLSANKAADELNRRGIATPKGARWHALTVVRLRKRL